MNWYKHIVRRRYNSETIFSGKFKVAIDIYLEIIQYYCHFLSSKDKIGTFCLIILNTMLHSARFDKCLFPRKYRFPTLCRIQFWMLITAFGHNCRIISLSFCIQPKKHNTPICLREALDNTEHKVICLKQVHCIC